MSDKDLKVIENIEKEISKIDKKENRIFFFVIDTKGVPSGSLEYIYNLALILKEEGYNVSMLHTEEEFVGVSAWLDERYANLPHYNVNKGEVGTQWGDFGIMEGITNSDYQAAELNESFPYVKLRKVTPFISKLFGKTNEPRKMVVNIVSKDQSNIKKIVKPFYWKYPMFKWVSFKELRNLSKEDFAKALREGAITIIVDEDASFGYAALESIKSGAITMCKVPETELDWASNEDGTLPNCCVWFNDYSTLHKQLASVVRSWIMDKVPAVLEEEGKKVLEKYSYDKTKGELLTYVNDTLGKRKKEMEELIIQIKAKKEEE